MQLVFSHFCFSLSYGTKWHDCSRPRLLFLDWLTSACPTLHMSAVTMVFFGIAQVGWDSSCDNTS